MKARQQHHRRRRPRVPCHLARARSWRFWADCGEGGGGGGKWKVLTSSRPPPPSLGRRRTTALPAGAWRKKERAGDQVYRAAMWQATRHPDGRKIQTLELKSSGFSELNPARSPCMWDPLSIAELPTDPSSQVERVTQSGDRKGPTPNSRGGGGVIKLILKRVLSHLCRR